MTKQVLPQLGVALLALLFLLTIGVGTVFATVPTSMSVDFDSTTDDLDLRPGESGVLILVVENTGGQNAENVRVKVYSTTSLLLSGTFSLGNVVADESKTIPIIVKASDQAQPGLTKIKVQITYDGYDSDSDLQRNEYTYWEIPVWISGDPVFQVNPVKTTYFEGALENLTLKCSTMNSVKELESVLDSGCLNVIGPSKKYIGDVGSDEKFDISYSIKPSSSGACPISLNLSYIDEFGNREDEIIAVGLNVEEAGVDFKVISVKYDHAGPGDKVGVKIILKNEGSVASQGTTLSLTLEDPFVPVDGIEKYVGDVAPRETIEVDFELYVSWDAVAETYSVPLNIDYKIGGSSYSEEKSLGIDVSGEVMLEILSVESTSGSVRVQVANIGTRSAESVKATLAISSGGAFPQGLRGSSQDSQDQSSATEQTQQSRGQQIVDYKSSIKVTKEATFTFSTSYTGTATLTLEYTGVNNERVKQTEQITIGSGTSLTSDSTLTAGRFTSIRRGGGSPFDTLIYVVAAVILGYLGYRYYKKRRKGEVKSKGWKNLFGFI